MNGLLVLKHLEKPKTLIGVTFSELEESVKKLRSERFYQEDFNRLDEFPLDENFSEDTINYFIKNGTKVLIKESLKGQGYLRFSSNSRYIIEIKEGLNAFERDCTLFHELVHACFNFSRSFMISGEEEYWKLEAIVELNARKLRAQPPLLRHAIKSFKLPPKVYDLASYKAFPDHPQQLLQFMPSVYEQIGIQME